MTTGAASAGQPGSWTASCATPIWRPGRWRSARTPHPRATRPGEGLARPGQRRPAPSSPTRVGGGHPQGRDEARPRVRHAGRMRLTARWPPAAASPGQRPGTPIAAPGMAWPGTLVARALAAGQQWWHRRVALLAAAAAVTAAAVLSGLQHHPTISARVAVVAAVAATAPLAALRRYPGAALAIMLPAQARM